MSDVITFPAAFNELSKPEGIGPSSVRAAFDAIFSGGWTPTQVAGFVVALRMRDMSAAVVASAVEALRGVMVPVEHGLDTTLDTCGTGGDGLGTLNVSTAAAIIVASLGITVAKHGNRAASSQTGTADVLEVLGIPVDLPADCHAAVLREAGITFLFAPTHHPAMRHAAVARRELGIRTIFNIIGPLSNPARVSHQLLGTADELLRPVMAATLRALGTRRAWVVRGEDGLDEVSPCGPTRVTELDGDVLRERVITPHDFGLTPIDMDALRGGDAQHNARELLTILRGEPHPARSAIVLNAAAAVVVARGIEPKAATAEVERALSTGKPMAKLEQWKAVSSRVRAS